MFQFMPVFLGLFDGTVQKLMNGFRDIFYELAYGNLSTMLTDLNEKVGTISTELATSPDEWQGGTIWTLIEKIAEQVALPVAGTVFTFVVLWELIYEIRFHGRDGAVGSTKEAAYGQVPEDPQFPLEERDGGVAYILSGWHYVYRDADGTEQTRTVQELQPVSGEADYYAQYSAEPLYEVSFLDWDGTEIAKASYRQGETVAIPQEPQREGSPQADYSFSGWEPQVQAQCSGEAIYRASYTETARTYTVRFLDMDGSIIKEEVFHYGDGVTPPQAPEHKGMEFTGWVQVNPEIVIGDFDMKATYREVQGGSGEDSESGASTGEGGSGSGASEGGNSSDSGETSGEIGSENGETSGGGDSGSGASEGGNSSDSGETSGEIGSENGETAGEGGSGNGASAEENGSESGASDGGNSSGSGSSSEGGGHSGSPAAGENKSDSGMGNGSSAGTSSSGNGSNPASGNSPSSGAGSHSGGSGGSSVGNGGSMGGNSGSSNGNSSPSSGNNSASGGNSGVSGGNGKQDSGAASGSAIGNSQGNTPDGSPAPAGDGSQKTYSPSTGKETGVDNGDSGSSTKDSGDSGKNGKEQGTGEKAKDNEGTDSGTRDKGGTTGNGTGSKNGSGKN